MFAAARWVDRLRVAAQRDHNAAMLDHLTRWARREGYELLHHERRSLSPWFPGGAAYVYYVTVRDPQGSTRRGWVRCGGRFLGQYSERVDVLWDDPPPAPTWPTPTPTRRDDPLWDPWMDG